MNQKLAIVLFAFALVVAVVVGFGPKEEERVPPAAVRAKVLDSLKKVRDGAPPNTTLREPSRMPAAEKRAIQTESESELKGEPLVAEDFNRKYGERIVYQSYEDRVVRIDGARNRVEELASDQKTPDFRSSNQSALVARGREILVDAREILGIPREAQFLAPIVNPGELSGQVTFQQSLGGVPISPGGLVTIVIGSEGELRAVDSSIYPVVEIASQRQGPVPAYHREILYVTQSNPVAIVRYAYESRNEGVQKIIDANSRKLLFERDRRVR